MTTAPIHSVAVLGAGTMGAQIAAHVAGAGVAALLLDVTPDAARDGLKRARGLKPDPFFTPEAAALITTGGFETDLAGIAHVDWIIEAVVEQLDVKRSLLGRVDAVRRPGTIVSSNTSGIPIVALAEGRSDDFRRHWLGTHFFNPGCSRSSRPGRPIPRRSNGSPASPMSSSARVSSSQRIRPTSSPITSDSSA